MSRPTPASGRVDTAGPGPDGATPQSDQVSGLDPEPQPPEPPRSRALRYGKELGIVLTFYGLYTLVRDIRGERSASVAHALTNAHRVIRVERVFGLFHEAALQQAFIHDRGFMRFWDGFYGTVHFLAVIGVLVFLFVKWPQGYRRWRNTMAIMTALALVGFAFFPLLPPRLLPPGYHFVDSLETIGGLWDFKSGAINEVSNQYAAMPSLHTGWSTWCALALWPLVRRRWLRPLLLLYPLATIFCIVVTANHYFADVAGGFVVLAVAYGAARLLESPRLRGRGPFRSLLRRAEPQPQASEATAHPKLSTAPYTGSR
ncbi:MAG: phosphatase PAP2 family protein [Acidimicrobiales bacterium]